MGIIGKDFKYIAVKNFIDDSVIKILETYTNMNHRLNLRPYPQDHEMNNYETGIYGDRLMESIMLNKQSHVEKITGKKLLPTYSYWRMYTNLGTLPKYHDRESCEISVSFNIATKGEDWPIYMDGNPVYTKPGDAVIYLGAKIKHYRKEFKGDYSSQCFLHYVDKDGPYTDFAKDKRAYYGLNKKNHLNVKINI